jgi:DNA invertase Pin-like site-specific DNA recombinase
VAIISPALVGAAKLERRRILERTARGRGDAKEKGVKFGRKPILIPHQSVRPANASKRARRSAAWRAATTSVKARFHGFQYEISSRHRALYRDSIT